MCTCVFDVISNVVVSMKLWEVHMTRNDDALLNVRLGIADNYVIKQVRPLTLT